MVALESESLESSVDIGEASREVNKRRRVELGLGINESLEVDIG